jgi:hypothetical protein
VCLRILQTAKLPLAYLIFADSEVDFVKKKAKFAAPSSRKEK